MGKLPFERIPRDELVRKEITTQSPYGLCPKKRPIKDLIEYGIINIDKPAGPTSHQVSAYVKQILNVRKTGHSGTLDPGVTGVLPVATGRGTRIVQSLLTAGKEYICLMRLHEKKEREEIEAALKKFTGKLRQMPPVKSAVKRQWRYRNVYYSELLDFDGFHALVRIGCQAGTYIRKYVHDLGVHLGCGAHMAELRRTKAGPFQENSLATLHDLKDAIVYWQEHGDEKALRKILHPIERAVTHLPKIVVVDSAVNALCQGATLKVPGISTVQANIQVGEPVAVFTNKDELILVGTSQLISKQMVKLEKGVALKSSQVFMSPEIYPKLTSSS